MKIFCKQCRKTIGAIADDKLPKGKKASVTCPVCQGRIVLMATPDRQRTTANPLGSLPPEDTNTGTSAGDSGGPKKNQPVTGSQGIEKKKSPSSFYMGGTTKLNIAAGVIFLLLLGCFAVRFWAFSQKSALTGPSHVAYNNEQVWVHVNGVLYMLDKNGRLQKELELDSLGIEGPLEDLEILANGNLMIGDLATGTIFNCNPDNESCNSVGPEGENTIADNFKFLVDEERNVIFIGDTNNHRLLLQNLDGGDASVLRRKLSYPNDMYLQENGELLLCDTFHFRVLTLDYQEDGNVVEETVVPIMFSNSNLAMLTEIFKKGVAEEAAKEQQIQDISEQVSEYKLNRPMSLARDHNGKLWVASGSEAFMFGAEVRLYDNENNLLNRFDQDVSSCPEDVVRKEASILIADTDKYKVFQVNPDSYLFSNFGDADFNEILDSELGKKNMYAFLIRWAFRLMFVSAVLLVVVYVVGKRNNG